MLAMISTDKFITTNAKPIHSEDGRYTILFKGRIYNAKALMRQLNKVGTQEDLTSDALIALEMYRYTGARAWADIRGDFAIIIYDEVTKQIVAARDSFGIQSLYYRCHGEALWISTSLSLLTEPGLRYQLDKEALSHYFTFQFIPEEFTYAASVRHINAGCFLQYRLGCTPIIEPFKEMVVIDGQRASLVHPVKLREAVVSSVYERMKTDDVIGTFLSGGIDSTIVTKIAKQFDPNLKAFSIGYDLAKYSELDDAQRTADCIGVELISRKVSADEYWQATLDSVKYLDSPIADPSMPMMYLLTKLASKYVDVALSGEGADELFGGYPIYQEVDSLGLIHKLGEKMQQPIKAVANGMPAIKGKNYLLRATTDLCERYAGNAFIYNDEEKAKLLTFATGTWRQVTDPIYAKITDLTPMERMQTIDLHTWVKGDILPKAIHMARANQLEIRMPFLDETLLSLAADLTKEEKVYKGRSKVLLRQAFEKELPKHMRNMGKRGFPVPLATWMRYELSHKVQGVLGSPLAARWLNVQLANQMLAEHLSGRKDHARKLWTLVIFVLWLKEKEIESRFVL